MPEIDPIEIDQPLAAAFKRRLLWSQRESLDFAGRLAEGFGGTIDFDEGSEDWIRVLRDRTLLALMRRDFPFAIADEAKTVQSLWHLEVVEVPSFEQEILTCSRELLEHIFPLRYVGDTGRFAGEAPDAIWSALDFWYMTL